MDANIKDKWTELVSDEELNIDAEWIYTLLNPIDKKEFFKIVNIIITRHSQGKDEDEERLNQVWTKAYKMMFKMTAVKYMIEFEKDNQAYIQTPITYPVYPTYPGTSDPYPWQLPQVYCITSTN